MYTLVSRSSSRPERGVSPTNGRAASGRRASTVHRWGLSRLRARSSSKLKIDVPRDPPFAGHELRPEIVLDRYLGERVFQKLRIRGDSRALLGSREQRSRDPRLDAT